MFELTPFPSTFPVETEENIIDHLSDSVPTLCSCALTCRAWLPRSRFYLLGAVRIKSGQQLEDFQDMLNTYPTRRSWINSATMAPIAKESNPRRLIEAFPAALLINTPNLRRWEINQTVVKAVKKRAMLFFHKTTLTRLRYSPIQELHLCSIQFGSYAELIRLLMALRQLDCLKCTNLGFGQESTAGMDFLKAKARRQLEKLSTLVVRDLKSTAISTLLEFVQDTLVNLHFDHIKGTKRDALPLPKMNTMPALSKLSLICLHWRFKEESSSLEEYLERVWTSAAGLTRNRLRWASNLQTIGLHLNFDDYPAQRLLVLAVRHTLESMKQRYLPLDTALSKMRLKKYLVSIHLPSQWAQADTILKTALEENLPSLHKNLTIEINRESDIGTEDYHVRIHAVAASPDVKWIATGSLHTCILWDVQHHANGRMTDKFLASVGSSRSLSFSPDSHRLAFHAYDETDFHVRRLGANGETTLLAVLPIPNEGGRHPYSYYCAWSHDGSKLSAVRFSMRGRAPVNAHVWETTTYTLLYVFVDGSSLERPLGSAPVEPKITDPPVVNCILDGHHLAITKLHNITPLDEDGVVPSTSSQPGALFSYHIWDITTGNQINTVDEFLREHPQYSCRILTMTKALRHWLTALCGDNVCNWKLSYQHPSYWIFYGEHRTPLSLNGLRRLSWAGNSSSFKIWDTHVDRCISTFRCAFRSMKVNGGCLSPDGQLVAVCNEDSLRGQGLVQVGTVSGGVLLGSFTYGDPYYYGRDRPVVFSRDGKTIYLGAPDGRLLIFPLPSPLPDPDHDSHAERWERCDDED